MRVHSNFFMYRTRAETEQDFYVGSREDVFRRVIGQLRVASRKIVLDQTVLLAKNLRNFFSFQLKSQTGHWAARTAAWNSSASMGPT